MSKIYYAKFLFLVIALYCCIPRSNASCTLTTSRAYSIAELTANTCLDCSGTSCATTTLIIPTGVTATIAQNTSWDFSAFTDTPLTIRIEGNGGILFKGGVGSAGTLMLPPGSKIEITNTANTNALSPQTGGGTGGIGRIMIGGTTYNQGQFSSIIAGGGADASGVLPVTLTAFTARAEDAAIALQWITATEENNDYFLLEHSLDGRQFERLSLIKGAGSSLVPQYYRFEHTPPVPGLNYYRLVQVDYDGTMAYFDVIPVHFKGKDIKWTVQPNPAHDFIELAYPNNSGIDARVSLYTFTGQEIQSLPLTSGPRTRISLPGNLPRGIYLLRIEREREVETKRVLVE